jgi:lipopolysaccharide export system permease protein
MLFHSTLRKDLSRSFGATVVVLATIVMTNVLIRTLGLATVGGVNPSEVMLVMGFSVLGHLTTILTLSLFIAIVSTLSRMYADSEMVIWFSSGQGLASFAAPIFRFAWPILVVITVLALVVWPWSNRQAQDLTDRYEAPATAGHCLYICNITSRDITAYIRIHAYV